MKKKIALITGITGQDGSYMAELLLEKGYKVFGTTRRVSNPNMERIDHIKNRLELINADVTDFGSIFKAIKISNPDEVYNLAAMSFVPVSWDAPILTSDIVALGVINVLESIKLINKNIRFYQASSSEMFGKVQEVPQKETTPFYPRSPYGIAKNMGHWLAVNYRESYGMFTCSGICFNHESPRRGMEFVTRKISYNVAKIKLGLSKELKMGNIDAKRDWGYAKDYVRMMWMMLQQAKPDDFVIATGETHSVREFLQEAFKCVGLDWETHVKIDKKLYRPAEVQLLIGDASKAKKKLGWVPKVTFKELVKIMVQADVKLLEDATKTGCYYISGDK
ncbi:MAG: GDP-mannose 4,6-dehydratase [bacterium]